ncbi:MAG: TRAP transporter substrate-binding protein [Hyphomicrobiales bacterium]
MKFKTALLASVMVASLATGASAAELRLSHSAQANFDAELHTTAWIFEKYLEDNSETVSVEIYPNNALGEERQVYEAMQLGSGADCVISGTAILGNFTDKVGVLDLPFMWQGYDHVHRVLDGEVGDALAAELRDSGFEVVAWLDSWGYRNVVTAGEPINEPEDLEGLRLRTIPTETYVAAINAMGADATPMSFGEIYTSMETGVLDGLEHSAAMIYANRFFEVADNITLTRHLFGPIVFACSSQTWEGLSDQERQEVTEAAHFARDVNRALAPVREQEALDALQEEGMTITEIDTSSMREAAQSLQEELAADRDAGDLLQTIREQAGS